MSGLKDDPKAQREYLLANFAELRAGLPDRDRVAFDLSARAIADKFIRICADGGGSLHAMARVVAAAAALIAVEHIARKEGGE